VNIMWMVTVMSSVLVKVAFSVMSWESVELASGQWDCFVPCHLEYTKLLLLATESTLEGVDRRKIILIVVSCVLCILCMNDQWDISGVCEVIEQSNCIHEHDCYAGHCPLSWILPDTVFWKLDMFPPSSSFIEACIHLGPLPKTMLLANF